METRNIGIAITHRNREEAFYKTYSHIMKYLPCGSYVVVVDDQSEIPCLIADYRFNDRVGIAKAKNKCIQLLMEHKCTDLFLFDSDCFPVCHDWHLPYIQSPYQHLCFTWPNAYQDQKTKQWWIEDGHAHYNLANGAMIYVTSKVINEIGGFRPEFGLASFEHIDFSNRISLAGFQDHAFIDVTDSDKLLYSLDANNEVERTFTAQEKAKLIQRNYPIFAKNRFNTNFVPYANDI